MSNILAIIGKSNVGKSTLFNRLINNNNKAIVNNKKGTTRDRKYGYSEWMGKKFIIIDTGGYIYNAKNILEEKINIQTEMAIKECKIILFLLDCQKELMPTDINLKNKLIKYNKPILLVVNKIDNYQIKIQHNDFYAIGIKNIYYISAINGYGTGGLLNKITTYFKDDKEEDINIPKIAILGKPNVGKSSFLNVITKKKRSIISKYEGTTRDSIDTYYNLYNKKFILIDTAGIRKKTKIKKNIEYYSIVKSIRTLEYSDICIVMIDSKNKIKSQDINIIKLAIKYKKGIIIVINKFDLIKKNNIKLYKKEISIQIKKFNYIPVLYTSVIKKQGIYQVIEKALEIYNNKNQKISTNKINNILLKSINKQPPSAINGKNIKIKYATQLSISSPTFILFCNFPEYIQNSYKNYIKNQLRKNFTLIGVPISLIFRKKKC